MNFRTPVIAVLLTAVLASSVASATSKNAFSEASQTGASVVVLSVLVTGSVLEGSVEASTDLSKAGAHQLSNLLSSNADWTVTGITQDQQLTRVQLKSANSKATLTLGIPSQDPAVRQLRINDQVTTHRLGKDTFKAEYKGQTLGVIADSSANLVHSQKRN